MGPHTQKRDVASSFFQKCDMVNIFIACFHAFDISLRNLFRQLLVLLYIYYYLCHILLEVCNNVEPIK